MTRQTELMSKAWFQFDNGDVPEAEATYKKAIEEGIIEAHFNLGKQYYTIKQFDKAIEQLNAYIASGGEQRKAYIQIALCHRKNNDNLRAFAFLNKAREAKSPIASYILSKLFEGLKGISPGVDRLYYKYVRESYIYDGWRSDLERIWEKDWE